MINRCLKDKLSSVLEDKKAVVLIGARQVGKSTLLRDLLGGRDDILWLNGDESDVVSLFDNITSTRLQAIIGGKKIVVIDEAQAIPDIGRKVKLITDYIEGVKIYLSGSSAFELSNKLNEPLTGRKREYKVYPLSFAEMVAHTSLLEEKRMIPHRLLYGYYPEVVSTPGDERLLLKEISDSYLYKDVLRLDTINRPEKLVKLLQALAMQIGSQISYNEIAQTVGLDSKTVEKYVDVLEKCFVIFRLGSYSRNLRNELKFSKKIYFWDLGIRNAVISNFSQVENRPDVGAMWENFLVVERMKRNACSDSFAQTYFWRTQQQNEIDLIEEEDGNVRAFEFKWNQNKSSVKAPLSFSKAYPDATFSVITKDNIEDFCL